MSKNELSEEEYNKYLKTVPPATIDDVSVDAKAVTYKLLNVGKNEEKKYVRVAFRNLTIEESQLIMKYGNTQEDNYIYYRHLVSLVSVEPKFNGYTEKDLESDWSEFAEVTNKTFSGKTTIKGSVEMVEESVEDLKA